MCGLQFVEPGILHICKSKVLSRGGMVWSLAALADVIGGNGSVCDWDRWFYKIIFFSVILNVWIASIDAPTQWSTLSWYPDCVFFLTHREHIERHLASPLELRCCYVAAIGLSGPLLWVYCLLAPIPTTHTHTHIQPAHSRTAAGGRACWQMHTSAGASWAVLMWSYST